MAENITISNIVVCDVNAASALNRDYDVGIWAAGYEERAGWFVQSGLALGVDRWRRVEFIEDRDKFSGPANISIDVGGIIGGKPGHRGWDGYWSELWDREISLERRRCGRPMRWLVDFSSMPRTVYGPLLMRSILHIDLFERLTFVYVPGRHSDAINGQRTVVGLRSLVGTEGRRLQSGAPAFVLGLGYDGILAETIVEFFQINRFSCLYAAPGVTDDAQERTETVNQCVLARSERCETAPAWKCVAAIQAMERMRDWYCRRDLVVIPMGPKPHVLGSVVLTALRPEVALRFAQTDSVRPVQVTVPDGIVPYFIDIIPAG